MDGDWFVLRGEQRVGPHSWQQMVSMARSGQIQPTDLIWHPTYSATVAANEVPGLLPPPTGTATGVAPMNQPMIAPEMVTTSPALPGGRITRSYGIVQSLVLVAAGYSTSLRMVGGYRSAMSEPSQQALSEAYYNVLRIAAQLGANAIVGFRFGTDQAGYMAYGTAVWVEVEAEAPARTTGQSAKVVDRNAVSS